MSWRGGMKSVGGSAIVDGSEAPFSVFIGIVSASNALIVEVAVEEEREEREEEEEDWMDVHNVRAKVRNMMIGDQRFQEIPAKDEDDWSLFDTEKKVSKW
jgi:hypothetical protein